MLILLNILLFIVNAIFTYINYKRESYIAAISNSFACGVVFMGIIVMILLN